MLSSVRRYLQISVYYLTLPFMCVLRSVGSALAVVFFPHCARRMFFVTSLYGELLSINSRFLSQERIYNILDELNREFSLCKDPRALGIALHFHHSMWKNTAVIAANIDRIRQEEMAEFCIGFAPPWLQYNKQRMYKDALQLIQLARRVHPLRSMRNPDDPVQEELTGVSLS